MMESILTAGSSPAGDNAVVVVCQDVAITWQSSYFHRGVQGSAGGQPQDSDIITINYTKDMSALHYYIIKIQNIMTFAVYCP